MFRQTVSSLSFSPAATSQLVYYWRRLKREQTAWRVSAVMAVGVAIVQLLLVLAPPDPATAASSNDVVRGGLNHSHPAEDMAKAYDERADVRGLLQAYGVSKADVLAAHQGTINSADHSLNVLGRNPHSDQDELIRVGNINFYIWPLFRWGDHQKYRALIGNRQAGGGYFAIIYNNGNLVVRDSKPIHGAKVVPVQSTLVKSAKASVVSGDGSKTDAGGATVKPGSFIEYTLTTLNAGRSDLKNQAVSINLNDVLEYADVVDPGGGRLKDGILSWPKSTIKSGQLKTLRFETRIKNPIPPRPTSVTDPKSFDLKMDTIYGNVISINLPTPSTAKQLELASGSLPKAGAGTDVLVGLILISFVGYFYFRNRQLVAEIAFLRADHFGHQPRRKL